MAMSSQVLRNGFSSFARPSDCTIGRVLSSPVRGAYQPRRGSRRFLSRNRISRHSDPLLCTKKHFEGRKTC